MGNSDVEFAVQAFAEAWKKSCKDYDARRLNSERCLQAALYFHLRKELEANADDFNIFIDATVQLPKVEADDAKEILALPVRRIAIDTVICKGREILVVAELKYTPRSFPLEIDIRKDLTSLSHIRNYTDKDHRVAIKMVRHRDTEAGDSLPLKIHPDARRLLGIFCKSDQSELTEKAFWETYRPDAGPWQKRVREFPPKLGLCLAGAPDPTTDGSAAATFLGKPVLQYNAS